MNDTLQRRDSRMRGFAARARVEEALSWLDNTFSAGATEWVSLPEAHGRVLAQEITATSDLPISDHATMDGYAVRGLETVGASPYNPLSLKLRDEIQPGISGIDSLSTGQTARISTGAALPAGADAVLAAEYAVANNLIIEVTDAIPPGENIRRRGTDYRQGTVVLKAGRRVRPSDVGLLATLGNTQVQVIRQPRVRLIVTGAELTQWNEHQASQRCESHSLMLRGLLQRDGAELESLVHVPDDPAAIRETLQQPGADLILIIGGSSVGQEDVVPLVLAELGEVVFHGLALRPARSAGMGLIDRTGVLMLPGNPAACLCAYDLFARRAIQRQGGRNLDWPYPCVAVPVAKKIVSAVGQVDYYRVRLTDTGVEPLTAGGASLWSSITRADGFIVIAEDSEGYPPGASVTVYCYDLVV
ncbi:MAG: molybdopterin molybdotransferase MoeA [Candidatus Competibacteraceae bacterium]|nr:molybdopterin molybdotransferase MoeA [Candidatus Competibacteraceae bacterium]